MSDYATDPLDLLGDDAVPLRCVGEVPAEHAALARAQGFEAKPGQSMAVFDGEGRVAEALAGAPRDGAFDALSLGAAARALPEATYRPEGPEGEWDADAAALGFLLGGYDHARYRKAAERRARLAWPQGADPERVERIARAVYLARDLVNTPANDLGPDGIEMAARGVAERGRAQVAVTAGDDLRDPFPMIHAVGRASANAPRLIDMAWGGDGHPRVTLVGKGVAFDTGGLNIKPGSSMALMKKDMGGAACVLALAQAVMDAKLPVRLRVLVPAVENAIAGNSFRPGDVLRSRKGTTVEIGNTDAEGRLILADALALADEDEPDLLVDMATLTGAARVALGPDLPPLFTEDDAFAEAVAAAGRDVADPVWRMPLWAPYNGLMKSRIADVSHINTSGAGFAGAITAALFLQRFVERAATWAHLDVFCWVPEAKPHAPPGGEGQAVRALLEVLERRYPSA